jgi:alpha-tubulin suppressor-like RCC1 family protein
LNKEKITMRNNVNKLLMLCISFALVLMFSGCAYDDDATLTIATPAQITTKYSGESDYESTEQGESGSTENATSEHLGKSESAAHLNTDSEQKTPQLFLHAGAGQTMIVTEDGELWIWGHLHGGTEWCTPCQTDSVRVEPYPIKIMNDVVAVSTDWGHTTALRANGTVWTWGRNYVANLGDGTTVSRQYPLQIMENVVAASGTRAIMADGSLWGWGGVWDAFEDDNISTHLLYPRKIMEDVVAVSDSVRFTLAIRTDGSLWSWGTNNFGQLGDGSNTTREYPVQIMDDVVAVSAGNEFAMAIKTDGSLWGWGRNFFDVLGDGANVDYSPYPLQIMDDVVAVSAGWSHVLAIRTDGSLWAWGSNTWGQIGDRSGAFSLNRATSVAEMQIPGGYIISGATELNRPTPIRIMEDVISISAGPGHSLAITSDGTVWAWGDNHAGQLGVGTTVNSSTPMPILFAEYFLNSNGNKPALESYETIVEVGPNLLLG